VGFTTWSRCCMAQATLSVVVKIASNPSEHGLAQKCQQHSMISTEHIVVRRQDAG